MLLKPISPTLRKRLQKYYGYGTQKQKEGDYDYAHAMFSQCVVADPANILYVESMLNNLFAKYRGQKKKPKVRSSRSGFKKAIAEEQWTKVLKEGPDLLKENPSDVPTLRGMAEACAALRQNDERLNEIELIYLKKALDANPKDIEVNKHCAESLERIGQFDQAIACWHRIEELGSKSEAQQRISDLTVRKNMRANGMLDEPQKSAPPTTSTAEASAETVSSSSDAAKPAEKSKPKSKPDTTTVAGLEKAITLDPSKLDNYLALAKIHEGKSELVDAERVLRRAASVSGQNIKVTERLETVQIRRSRQRVAAAEQKFKKDPSDENRELVQSTKVELNRLELGIFNSRAQRYPDEKKYLFELAVCLKRAGKFPEAAKYFSQSAEDGKILPAAMLQRGECLQQVRQYQEAMRCYNTAASKAAEDSGQAKNAEIEQLAIYRAGVLAMGLRDQHQAKKLLGKLHERNPEFRDVAARLDKLKSMGDT